MTITLYKSTAEKNRVNKSGYLTAIKTATGALLAPTSMINPDIVFDLATTEEAPTANYAYISDFNRYYYITEWTANARGLWEASMTVDALMSFRGQNTTAPYTGIYALNGHFVRAEHPKNPMPDSLYPLGPGIGTAVFGPDFGVGTEPWYPLSDNFWASQTPASMNYVIQFLGRPKLHYDNTPGQTYPMTTIVCGLGSMEAFMQKIIGESASVSGKPMTDYLYSIYALPFEPDCESRVGYDVVEITNPGIFNDIEMPSGHLYWLIHPTDTGFLHQHIFKFTIPAFTSMQEPHQRYNPFRRYSVDFPPFGTVELDPRVFMTSSGSNSLYLSVITDVITGDSLLYYGPTSDGCVNFAAGANLAMSVPFSAQSLNATKIATGVFGAVASIGALVATIATEGGAAPLLASAAGAAGSIGSTVQSAASASGSVVGGKTSVVGTPTLRIQTYLQPTIDYSIFGMADNYYGKVGDYTPIPGSSAGFLKAGEIHMDGIAATEPELAQIALALRQGVLI